MATKKIASIRRILKKKKRKILRHGSVHWNPLIKKQRRLFGDIAGGKKIRKVQ